MMNFTFLVRFLSAFVVRFCSDSFHLDFPSWEGCAVRVDGDALCLGCTICERCVAQLGGDVISVTSLSYANCALVFTSVQSAGLSVLLFRVQDDFSLLPSPERLSRLCTAQISCKPKLSYSSKLATRTHLRPCSEFL